MSTQHPLQNIFTKYSPDGQHFSEESKIKIAEDGAIEQVISAPTRAML